PFSLIKRKELLSEVGFMSWDLLSQGGHWQSTVLKTSLLKDRHGQSSNSFDAARDDFAFERVKARHLIVSEGDKRNAFCHFDDVGARERAEAREAIVPCRGVGACVGSA